MTQSHRSPEKYLSGKSLRSFPVYVGPHSVPVPKNIRGDGMQRTMTSPWGSFARTLSLLSMIILGLFAASMIAMTGLALAGILPWILQPSAGASLLALQNAMYMQIGLTLVALALLFLIPSVRRVMQLEDSHRTFRMSMKDVTEAYYESHRADRRGMFTMRSEFDAVRERIDFLNQHPDLGELELDVLEVAAQMSKSSEDLAQRYSDDKVQRAKAFLSQRQQDMAQYEKRISRAISFNADLKTWAETINNEDTRINARLDTLETELDDLLRPLGFEVKRKESSVVTMDPVPAIAQA